MRNCPICEKEVYLLGAMDLFGHPIMGWHRYRATDEACDGSNLSVEAVNRKLEEDLE